MCQLCLIHFDFFGICICTERYCGVPGYWHINFFPHVVKYVRPTYGHTEELATLTSISVIAITISIYHN